MSTALSSPALTRTALNGTLNQTHGSPLITEQWGKTTVGVQLASGVGFDLRFNSAMLSKTLTVIPAANRISES